MIFILSPEYKTKERIDIINALYQNNNTNVIYHWNFTNPISELIEKNSLEIAKSKGSSCRCVGDYTCYKPSEGLEQKYENLIESLDSISYISDSVSNLHSMYDIVISNMSDKYIDDLLTVVKNKDTKLYKIAPEAIEDSRFSTIVLSKNASYEDCCKTIVFQKEEIETLTMDD